MKSQSENQFTNSQKYKLLTDMRRYMDQKKYKHLPSNFYSQFSLFNSNDSDRIRFSKTFIQMQQTHNFNPQKLKLSTKQSRGIAAVLGMGICDALGASTEFMSFEKQGLGFIQNGFSDITKHIKEENLSARSGRVGIWTDDASMGLAMGYSLLLNNFKFDPIHMRYMFILWLENGLGNGGRPHSIGLGGNISISMGEFMKEQTAYAQTGNQFNNGNGSLMRLATVPVSYLNDIKQAVYVSGQQSLTTHNGLQAKQCSRLLALIIIRLVNRAQNQNWKQVLQKACQQFQTPVQQVKYLAQSKQQSQQMYQKKAQRYGKAFIQFNKNPLDRNWNWKDKNHTYSPQRLNQQPGYIGSYCMDALAMALHTVWHTSSFKQCALINANFGGDCDTVGSIAGQIAGAIYGIDEKMLQLYSEMVDWTSGRFELFLMGYKLVNRIGLKSQVNNQKMSTEASSMQQQQF